MKHQNTWSVISLVLLSLLACFIAGCGGSEPQKNDTVTYQELPPPVIQPAPTPKPRKWSKRTKKPLVAVVNPAPRTSDKPVKRPPMPWKPTGHGKLDHLVVVLDPGHGGGDVGAGWKEVFSSKGKTTTVQFWEAAYTFRMTAELAQLLRKEGATVYLTEFSSVMTETKDPATQESAPVPRDAVFMADGEPNKSGAHGLRNRAKVANEVAATYPGKDVLFLSIHVDSMPDGWQGAHVCVDNKSQSPKLALAQHIAKRLVKHGYARKDPNGNLVSPIDPRPLGVLRHSSEVAQRVLIETSTPVSKADSYRLRCKANRLKLLGLIRDGIVEYRQAKMAKGSPFGGP